MKPEDRTKHLLALLGWQGGTIHDACKSVGVAVSDFLHGEADFSGFGGSPCAAFIRGRNDATECCVSVPDHLGDLQYWLGAVSALNTADV